MGLEVTELSGYEKVRAQNIERNNARLRSLGLISALEEKKSNANAWGTSCSTKKDKEGSTSEDEDLTYRSSDSVDGSHQSSTHEKGHSSKKKRKRHSSTKVPKEGSRKSLRLQGVEVDLNTVQLSEDHDIFEERRARVKECREMRILAAKEVAVEGAVAAAKENPTATYGHCLMRVTTMSDKGLAGRVKVIERAAGRHCVVKMAIFKSCLQDEGMWELADLASEALERLKALQPPPV